MRAMIEPFPQRASTQVSSIIKAPRRSVYEACIDPNAVVLWRVPGNMTGQVHVFDAREGGMFRMSLVYQDPNRSPGGKTSQDRDTFHGLFVELVPYEKIVEAIVFESSDPQFAGEMKITTRLTDTDDGTEITILCEGIPVGIRAEDNEAGSRSSLQNLAALMEQRKGLTDRDRSVPL
jgi:uncharacterized protein YndB with AHSA1/START domain